MIYFEELYKIDPHQARIHRNILSRADVNLENREAHLSLEYIWKRRNNLHGSKFQGVTEYVKLEKCFFVTIPRIHTGSKQNMNHCRS